MNGLVSKRGHSASGAGTVPVSVPHLQHSGQEGIETAFWTPLGCGTFWKQRTGQQLLWPQEGPWGTLNIRSEATKGLEQGLETKWHVEKQN